MPLDWQANQGDTGWTILLIFLRLGLTSFGGALSPGMDKRHKPGARYYAGIAGYDCTEVFQAFTLAGSE